MASQIHMCPPYQQLPGEFVSLYFFHFEYRTGQPNYQPLLCNDKWVNTHRGNNPLAWKILDGPCRPMSNTGTQNRWLFECLEVAHANLLGNDSAGVNTGRPRGRWSQAVDLRSRVTGTKETMFTQVRALLMEVKPYVLPLFILMKMYQVHSWSTSRS